MKEEIIEKYKKAGKIAKEAIDFAVELVKENEKAIDVAEKVEDKIIELGGKPAWPVNFSINSIAAHWTPKINDETIFQKGDLVKIDVGVHVEGYIADTARTIEIGTNDWKNLIQASEEALKNALEIVKPGVTLSEIGAVIEETIKSHGFAPIANLSGHGLDEYENHTSPTIPNFDNKSNQTLKEGDVIAIEPFATDGIGKVIDAKDSEIYKIEHPKPVRQMMARKILNHVAEENMTLPFCKRWVAKEVGNFGLEMGFRELKRVGAIHNFSVLKEESNGMVSQAEHTVIVLDEPVITTI